MVIKSLFFLYFIIHVRSLNQEIQDGKLAEELYRKLFKRQRAEQLEALKSFKRIDNNAKQYSLIKVMAENIFTVIEESRAIMEVSPYTPGISEFPLDNEIREALSKILENTALFSETILRFPDISTSLLQRNSWDMMFRWAIAFSYDMKYLLDKNTVKMLDLVSQELNYIERDLNYINPYRQVEKQEEKLSDKKKHAKGKIKIKKVPKLSIHPEL